MEGFFNKERILTHNFDERRVTLGVDSVLSGNGAICPEYELNPGLYNQLFTGTDFEVKLSLNQLVQKHCSRNGTYLYSVKGTTSNINEIKQFKIVSL
jgi:hypothetical protein